eukprot:c3611_g1_i1.p1 GENE.c3611_g1_i1~~c3611_g1_i1.p1  ORF type:complete len:202 (+),score=31.24 c3611_g1_i1:41-607(+)
MESFCGEVLRSVVLQGADAVGFHKTHESAVNTLADVLRAYLLEIGQATHVYSEVAGRTEANVHDVLIAFEDIGVEIEDLKDYVAELELDAPPCQTLPPFPGETTKPAALVETEPPPDHVPDFLPQFPARVYYKTTSTSLVKPQDPEAANKAKLLERRQVSSHTVYLHVWRTICVWLAVWFDVSHLRAI